MGTTPRTTMKQRARPTLTEVAALAGVSRQTASRVARGGEAVAPATEARVRAAIDAIGYQPDLVARALSTGSAKTIGVLGHHMNMFGVASVVAGIEMAAQELDWRVSIANVPEFTRMSVLDSIDRLVSSGCDGVILAAPWLSDVEALNAIQARIPVVTTSHVVGYTGSAAYPDAVASSAELVNHLLELGHETVWHVSGPSSWNASALRVTGWRQALEAAGASINNPLPGDWSPRSGYEAGLELALKAGVTAIFAGNDDMALGVIHALTKAGIRVPEDVSVVGYDGTQASEFFLPPLTTVRVDHLEQGRQAVDLIVSGLHGQSVNPLRIVPHELIARASSARCPPRSPARSASNRS